MKKALYLFFVITSLVFFSCGDTTTALDKGQYTLIFQSNDTRIPIRLEVTDSTWNIHNATETISVRPQYFNTDSFVVEMPLFHTYLTGNILPNNNARGHWIDPTRKGQNSIAFHIQPNQQQQRSLSSNATERIWDCTFSPDQTDNTSKAVGIFQTDQELIYATFLTETGDFRFLEGNSTGQSVELSCFDGTHLFYFCANIKGDSLTDGHFISGNSWEEKWEAALNPEAKLRDPDSLTHYNAKEAFHFTALDLQEKRVSFDSSSFRDKVTIVQIFGSWCPNCTDESKFLKEVYVAYANQGLQILPVAFEREATTHDQLKRIERQFMDLGLPYPPYLGGTSPKSTAESVFPQLNHVISYPTTIILDKKGQVRKIHTGFYGPGTGQYYVKHKEQLTLFIEKLLAET